MRRRWNEADLEFALALAPEALGLEDAMPVTRSGSSNAAPAVSPDQMYLDSIHRAHLIEIKDEPAKLDAVAQVLGFGNSSKWKFGSDPSGSGLLVSFDHDVHHHSFAYDAAGRLMEDRDEKTQSRYPAASEPQAPAHPGTAS